MDFSVAELTKSVAEDTFSVTDLVLVVNFLCPSVTENTFSVAQDTFSITQLVKSALEVPFSASAKLKSKTALGTILAGFWTENRKSGSTSPILQRA